MKPGAERNVWRPDSIMTWTADSEGTLMDTLLGKLTDHKRTAVKSLLKYGQVALNSTPVTQFDLAVHPGDKLSVNFTRPFVVFSSSKIRLVYEDDDIIVINKNNGVLSVSTDNKKDGTAYSILRDYLKRKNPNFKLFIIHRLDRDTSGLMMFAKNIEAKEAMQHNWNNMVLNRKYVAVVEGKVEQEEGTIHNPLQAAEDGQRIFVDGAGARHWQEKPDTCAYEGFGASDCRRQEVWRQDKPSAPARVACPYFAFRASCHKKGNEVRDSCAFTLYGDGVVEIVFSVSAACIQQFICKFAGISEKAPYLNDKTVTYEHIL